MTLDTFLHCALVGAAIVAALPVVFGLIVTAWQKEWDRLPDE